MKKVLVIDNYDSFTYNLVHILMELGLGNEVEVRRNDKIAVEYAGGFENILLSPGPGLPKDAGIMPKVIDRYGPTKNILGVCLGHQGIAECYGAGLFNLPLVYHGVATKVIRTKVRDRMFEGIPNSFKVCRYHSWAVKPESMPGCLEVTVKEGENNVMAFKHKIHNVRGVQFHPESIMTEHGAKMIANWLSKAS